MAPAQPFTRQRLRELREGAGSPALAAAVARRGRPAQIWVDGERAVGKGIPVGQGDVWHLGSNTKSMTASLVARLVDAGMLGWDDTVGEVLKTVAPDMDGAYRDATLRHLLSHCAGLPCDLPDEEFAQLSPELPDAREGREAYVRIALEMEPCGRLGGTSEYSNNGYVVAAAMLEARLGRSWEDLIRRHLFEPLGLSTAGFGAPGRRGAIDHPVGHLKDEHSEARSAVLVGDEVTDNPAVLGPAGRVHMSLQDLLRYLAAHRDRTAFLKPQSWATLHAPPFGGDYAMGWTVSRDGTLWHNGSNTMWYAEVWVDSAAGIAAAAACNDDYAESEEAVGSALAEAVAAAGTGDEDVATA